jgi:hypothetical protein
MSGKDLVLRVAVPAILILFVLPVVVVTFDIGRMWMADLKGQTFQAGPISVAFMSLIGPANGPYTLLHKGIGVLGSGAIVATLWSRQDRVLDTLMIVTLAMGLLASLLVWWMLETPDVYQEVWQSANLPNLTNSKSFGELRDKFFTDEISALISFGAVLTGIKLKGDAGK